MGKKILAAIVGSLILAVLAFMGYVLKNYGDFNNIPHYDVTMWIFWIVFGILIVLVLLAVILLYALSLQDREEPVDDGSYFESSLSLDSVEKIEEEAVEETVETPVEEQTEEEAPEIEVPEPSELVEEPVEEEAVAETKEETVEHPAEWDERKFE